MGGGVSRWTRLWLGAQVLLALLLAGGAAVLLVDLSESNYVRIDLSESGRNTIDPAVLELIENLPEKVEVDVFFRPLQAPYFQVTAEAQQRMLELLFIARNTRRDRVEVTVHDLSDLESVQARQRELGVQEVNLIVLSCGERRTILRLFTDVADVDWGNPTFEGVRYLTEQGIAGVVDPRSYNPDPAAFRPPRLSLFYGEEALARGLLKVSSGEAPRVYFAKGHGEPDLDSSLSDGLGRLRATLERDGFEVLPWEAGAVPADCEVLALVGGSQPFQEAESRAVRDYVERGGRVLVAPDQRDFEEPFEHGPVELLANWGIPSQPGIICEPVTTVRGESVDGTPECSLLLISNGLDASHPITEPLKRHGRRIQFGLAHSFLQPGVLGGGTAFPLVTSSPESWRDLADSGGNYNYRKDADEKRGRARLVMQAEFSPLLEGAEEAVRRPRILAIGSSTFCGNSYVPMNRDFLLNAFNWLAERDYRVRVSPREPGISRLDLQRGKTLSKLAYVLWLYVPASFILIGILVAWRRRARR